MSDVDSHPLNPALEASLFFAARENDLAQLSSLLDAHPGALAAREAPYAWTLLHAAAHRGALDVVDELLRRGVDVNLRELGDQTSAMHWAAAAGHLEVVRRLADAGGEVIGAGDDHQLEVIGWATCWEGCSDPAHRAIAELLVSRGARHHIFSAIALNLGDEVRNIVAESPGALHQRMSRNESHQAPLHFATRLGRPAMVALLLELGADPLVRDGDGQPVAAYATSPDVDRPVMVAIHAMTRAELDSADRGHRPIVVTPLDLMAALTLGDDSTAERLVQDVPNLLVAGGALHLLVKRNDRQAVRWLLAHGADVNARWAHWDAEVTPLHMLAWHGDVSMARLLLGAGGDPTQRDSKHDGDALAWAEHFGRDALGELLREDWEAR